MSRPPASQGLFVWVAGDRELAAHPGSDVGALAGGALLGQFWFSHLDVCAPTGRPSAQ